LPHFIRVRIASLGDLGTSNFKTKIDFLFHIFEEKQKMMDLNRILKTTEDIQYVDHSIT